jgi:uncharacterized RmlC-like cupin family protein
MSSSMTSRDGEDAAAGADAEVVCIRPSSEVMTLQRVPYFFGISGASAGARGLSMHLVVIPPGAEAEPHVHRGYETAIYVLEGHVETRYGRGLKKSVVSRSGDFLFIPADVPHQPVNLSTDHPARAIVARNDPDEQEHVLLYDPANEG